MKSIQKPSRKSVILFIGILLMASVLRIQSTRSFFFTSASTESNVFSAGMWIPTLTMEVDPEEPDGDHGWYTEAPCVKFFSDIEDVTIHYYFTGELPESGTIEEDKCVYPPDGESSLLAYAENNANADWYSNDVTAQFKVGIPPVAEGDVVMNEIMWMGSFGDPDDEWIELKNNTKREIDLSGWNIQNAGKGKGDGAHIEIPSGYSIKADGYFLIAKKKWDETAIKLDDKPEKDEGYFHVSGMDLDDEGEQLILTNKNKNGVIIDIANDEGKWLAGDNEIMMQSMERDEKDPGEGDDEDSWKTCQNDDCRDGKYWIIPDSEEGLNFGTPGEENIFE